MNLQTGSQRRQVQQVVNVQSNDPTTPNLRLTLKATVNVELEIIPTVLQFVAQQPGQPPANGQVVIKNYSDNPVALSDIESTLPYVKVSLSGATIPARGEVVLTGELLPDAPKGQMSGWVKMKSDLRAFPDIQIRIWGDL